MSINLANMSQLHTYIEKLPELLPRMTPEVKREALNLLRTLATDANGWPLVYTNRDTGRMYEPHNEQEARFVYSDDGFTQGIILGGEGSGKSTAGIVKGLNRIRRGMSGLMACVAPETMIEGVPIGDRHTPFISSSHLGAALSSAGFVEERADLFRVEMSTGDRVLVTRSHRFLSPTGWRQLDDLHVGELIAVDACDDDHCDNGTRRGSLADYFGDCRQYGGWASSEGLLDQDRLRQPVLLAMALARSLDYISRACTEDSFSPVYLAFLDAFQSVVLAAADIMSSDQCGTCAGFLLGACNSRNLGSSHPHHVQRFLDSVYSKQSDHSLPESCLQYSCYSPQPQQSLSGSCLHQTSQLSSQSDSYTYSQYTTKMKWAQIRDITFAREGAAYGLFVPKVGYYSANNVISHNSPNLPHFQRSLWKEFQRWCPWDCVIPAHRRMADLSWLPVKPFDIVFNNNAYIHCVGVVNAGSLEGPNLNWAHFDEARHYDDASAVKVLGGRIRIEGPNAEQPQMWFTTTPRMNWLYEFFGPLRCECPDCGEPIDGDGNSGLPIQETLDERVLACPKCGRRDLVILDDYPDFKMDSYVVRLDTEENRDNLSDDFVQKRGQSLTEKEKKVLIKGLWGEIEQGQPFLPSMTLWDRLQEDLPPLDPRESLVVAVDAATKRQLTASDHFAIVGISRHPDPTRMDTDVAIRVLRSWQGLPGQEIDFRGTDDDPGPERFLLWLCGYMLDDTGGIVSDPDNRGYNVISIVYDPYQLTDMAQRFRNASVAWMCEFGQSTLRYESDRQLLNLIEQQRIAHDGDYLLRSHLKNADRQLDSTGHRLRIVKRTESQHVDLAVATSMAAYKCLELNL